MIKKIPCGGFSYDDTEIAFEDGVIHPIGGGASGYDEISGGNITEVDEKKVLTPLGGGVIIKPLDVEISVTATEDGEITWGEEPIAEGELIVGETYRVTVNGVTGDYVCYVDEYDQNIIGTFEDDMTVGDWQISSYGDKIVINVFGSVGDEFTFKVFGKVSTLKKIDEKYLSFKPIKLYTMESDGGEYFYAIDNDTSNRMTVKDANELIAIGNSLPAVVHITNSAICAFYIDSISFVTTYDAITQTIVCKKISGCLNLDGDDNDLAQFSISDT